MQQASGSGAEDDAISDEEKSAESARLECERLAAEIRRVKDLVRDLKNEIKQLRDSHERLTTVRPSEGFVALRTEISRRSAEMRALQSRIGALLLRHLAAEKRLEAAGMSAQARMVDHLRSAALHQRSTPAR